MGRQNANALTVAKNASGNQVPLETTGTGVNGGSLLVSQAPVVGTGQKSYAVIAASQANVAVSGNTALGDNITDATLVFTAVNPGNVTVNDGNVAIPLYVASGNIADTKPASLSGLTIEATTSAGLHITTGAGVEVVLGGVFTQ